MQRILAGAALTAMLAIPVVVLQLDTAAADPVTDAQAAQAAARLAAPVVMTGAQLPGWSGVSVQGVAAPYPSGSHESYGGDGVRSAHNGTLAIPPASAWTGIYPDQIAAFSWSGSVWKEIPVQTDQRFPYFLANGNSDFAFYSGTDEELTYAWATDGHSIGDEAWKNVFGECSARKARDLVELETQLKKGLDTGPGEPKQNLLLSMADPVPTLDDDDELVFMARDAGVEAPLGAPPPAGTGTARSGQTVRVVDPLDPAGSKFVYLFQRNSGSSFTAATSYVHMTRDADADEWIDKNSFVTSGSTDQDPAILGTENEGYGPNIKGTVCRTAHPNESNVAAADGMARASEDRFPRDGMTVTTPTYKTTASGRWMVRAHQVTKPGVDADYGPSLISRWKGRAFQQSPDSSISLVGFEDEQVNWEANGALLGWRQGPVRAIREIWGADSGTNVTKTETYYRDADTYAYQVRVHPIPSDGLYTSWDYKPGSVTKYFNLVKADGVPIDGINDEQEQTSVDQLPGGQIPCPWAGEAPCPGDPAYFDAPDPTFDLPSAVDRPEEVAGPNGGLVYAFEFTGATSATNALAVPYYRDDDCLDDGTGDAAAPRPWPGYASSENRVKQGYLAYWQSYWSSHPEWQSFPRPALYGDLACARTVAEATAATPPWKRTPFAAAFGQHGIHFFTTQDSDNAFGPKPLTQIVGQQWRFSVPMSAAKNVVQQYGNNVSAKLLALTAPYGQSPPTSPSPSPSPSPKATPSPSSTPSPSPSGSPSPSSSSSPSPSASASGSPSPSPSASASASASSAVPSSTTSPSPAASCAAPAGNLPMHVNTPTVNATGLASVTVSGARPGATVQLQGYSQNHYGTVTFDNDPTPIDRTGTADSSGNVSFDDLRPASNTRLRAREAGCAYVSGATGSVITVRATETLRVNRGAPGTYTFSGESIPARPGGLIVSLYRITGTSCGAGVRPSDCPGEGLLTQARAQGEDAAGAGSYAMTVTFPAADRNQRISFVVKTGQDAQNAPGRSNNRSVLVY